MATPIEISGNISKTVADTQSEANYQIKTKSDAIITFRPTEDKSGLIITAKYTNSEDIDTLTITDFFTKMFTSGNIKLSIDGGAYSSIYYENSAYGRWEGYVVEKGMTFDFSELATETKEIDGVTYKYFNRSKYVKDNAPNITNHLYATDSDEKYVISELKTGDRLYITLGDDETVDYVMREDAKLYINNNIIVENPHNKFLINGEAISEVNCVLSDGATYLGCDFDSVLITTEGSATIDKDKLGANHKLILKNETTYKYDTETQKYQITDGESTFILENFDFTESKPTILVNGEVDSDVSEKVLLIENANTYNATEHLETSAFKSLKITGANDTENNITGSDIDDEIIGGSLADTITGGKGNDIIYGEAGNDTINGGAGNDTLYGGDGNDILNGDEGDDTIYGGAGGDTLNGGEGDDVLYGEAGNDTINGGTGDDTLYGGDDDDILNGGAGNDTLVGGSGNNTFIFNKGDGKDIITDAKRGDKIQFNYELPEDYGCKKNGDNLVINIDSNNSVTLKDYFLQDSDQRVSELFAKSGDSYISIPILSYVDVEMNESGKFVFNKNTTENYTINAADFISEKGIIVTNNSINSNNDITGSRLNDTITLKGGENIITENAGINKITTGAGADKITVSNYSSNTINAGAGKNTITLNSTGVNKVTAGNDINTIKASLGRNNIKLGNGANEITLTGGINTITAGNGANKIDLTNGTNTVKTGNGSNIVTINTKSENKVTTGKGDDTFTITDGFNTINSGGSSKAGKDQYTISGGYNTIKTTGSTYVSITADSNNTITTNTSATFDIANGYNTIKSTGLTTVNITTDSTNYITTGSKADTFNISNGTNTIKSGGGKDTIVVKGGINNIYGGAGADNITLNDGTNIVWADTDKIALYGGTNIIYTSNGKNTINVESGTTNTINLTKGNSTVNLKGTSSSDINVSAGNNTINLNGSSLATFTNTNKKGTTTVNVNDATAIVGQFGAGVDILNINSTNDTEYTVKSGAGNDKVTVTNAAKKTFYSEAGNDIFNINGGSSNNYYGGIGNDTFTVTDGSSNKFYGDEGKDTFNIKGGSSNEYYGGEGNDIFNVADGTSNELHGGEGVDTFNINGGSGEFKGEAGNDIYNLYKGASSSTIVDNSGANTFNIKKGYSGQMSIEHDSTLESTDKVVFDKSYKLSNASNVKHDALNNDIIVTNSSTLTLYSNYTASSGSFDDIVQFSVNMQNEIADKNVSNDSTVQIKSDMIGTCTVGGKNYTLNLDQLKADLAAWFADHSYYADSASVFAAGNENTINSLMAVYTQDTANCFVKA